MRRILTAIIDLFYRTDMKMTIDMERVNREARKQEDAMHSATSSDNECRERVKRRMTLGTKCNEPPLYNVLEFKTRTGTDGKTERTTH